MKIKIHFYSLLFLAVIISAPLMAAVIPNSLFSDHMVLQTGVPVPVWGRADEGEQVTVTFNGQTVQTIAKHGKWMVSLKKLKPGGPYSMTINNITITDIMVGEVWVCSGQSNMERQLGLRRGQQPIVNWEQEVKEADYPAIRSYYVPLKYSADSLEDIHGKWTVCSPATVQDFSAVGYFFARALYQKIKRPIGILFSAYGGTPAEHWTTRAALEGDTALMTLVNNYDKSVKSFPAQLEKYTLEEPGLWEKFKADSALAVAANKPLPRKPAPPADPSKRMIAGLYKGMIAPLIQFPIKGACWYQGEANNGREQQYVHIMQAMIGCWRQQWHSGEFPFLIVQIAPYKDMNPELREAQRIITNTVPNTALIVTTDCGDSADIHPPFKQPVGERLALAARALAYNEKLVYSGPVYTRMQIENSKVLLSFTATGKGLVASTGELKGFVICGADKQFVPAQARIEGNKVVVWSENISNPVAVRYGWANVPHVNLYNSEGLPAQPFKTD